MIVRLSPSGSIFCGHFLQKPRQATFQNGVGRAYPRKPKTFQAWNSLTKPKQSTVQSIFALDFHRRD
jgi:hypothetical protein